MVFFALLSILFCIDALFGWLTPGLTEPKTRGQHAFR